MEKASDRFPHMDPRFFPYLEKVVERLPPEVKDGLLRRGDFQFIADDGFLDKCILRKSFESPLTHLLYINTKILSEPDHRILLAVASQLAFYICSIEKPEPDCRDAEELLTRWGFTEELQAVQFDEEIAQSEEYQIGYRWARKQNRDYLVQHFGLYLEQYGSMGWHRGAGDIGAEMERREEAGSILEKLIQAKGPARPEAGPRTAPGVSSPRQAVLTGIIAALKEMGLQERYAAQACKIALK